MKQKMKYILLPVLLLFFGLTSTAFSSNTTQFFNFKVPKGATCYQTKVCDKTTCRYVAECDIPVIVRAR